MFISLYFQTFWPKWLIFFGHFKNTSVYDRKMTKKRPGMNIITFFLLPTCNFRKYADAGWSWTFAQQERNNCFGEISAFCPHRQAPFCNKRVMLKTLNNNLLTFMRKNGAWFSKVFFRRPSEAVEVGLQKQLACQPDRNVHKIIHSVDLSNCEEIGCSALTGGLLTCYAGEEALCCGHGIRSLYCL